MFPVTDVQGRRRRLGPAMAAVALVIVAGPHAVRAQGDETATSVRADGSTAPLAALNREIDRFDFEIAERAPLEFPPRFQRIIAEDRGFTRFGNISLTDEAAATGRWSLRFDLSGGSLAAAIPAGVVPVLPLADYLVSVQVRTSDLEHARARLVAWLHDADGEPIQGSRAESDPVRSPEGWTTLAVRVRGSSPQTAGIAFELQLLQPQHFGAADHPARPAAEDITGRAWFDDVSIRHIPRVELRTTAAHGLIERPEQPRIQLLVYDLTYEELTARLTVRDLAGEEVFSRSMPAPRGRHPATLQLPITEAGWYEAHLEIRTASGIVGRDRLSFAVLPSRSESSERLGRNPLAVEIPFSSPDELEVIPDILDALHVSGALITTWDRRMTRADRDQRHVLMREILDELITEEVRLTLVLNSAPQAVADQLNAAPADVLGLLASNPVGWRPHLDQLLINFGLRVPRWRLGSRPVEARTEDEFDRVLAQLASIRSVFDRIIPEPKLFLPIDAVAAVPPEGAFPLTHLLVPSEIRPGALGAYLEPWSGDQRELSLDLELLPAAHFGTREQSLDLTLRALHAWRAGVAQIAIRAPWQWVGSDDSQHVEPRPTFPLWRGLQRGMHGRTFAGELSLSEGIHCWLMDDAGGNDALVAWSDRRAADPPYEAELLLSDDAVRLVDAFGNERLLVPSGGVHTIPIGDMPVFVEGIDLALAQFRAAFSFDDALIPATHRVHERELVLSNSWDRAIAGTIRLQETPGLQVNPRQHEFYIQPGEEIRLPLVIVLDRGIIAGKKRVVADVRVLADREYTMSIHTLVEVGWRDVEMSATWRAVSNAETGGQDLVVTQFVTNRGERRVNLEAFLRAPGFGHNRRMLAALHPGDTIVSRYHLPDGVAMLAGRSVRVGLTERDGIAQLNHVVRIPELIGRSSGTRQTSVPTNPRP